MIGNTPFQLNEFLSTPSARRATDRYVPQVNPPRDFYPRPPRGGRRPPSVRPKFLIEFLSTPSARRATGPVRVGDLSDIISIHALREEGDLQTQALSEVPRGFLSTPSARRATTGLQLCDRAADDFYPRPPRGGRPRR